MVPESGSNAIVLNNGLAMGRPVAASKRWASSVIQPPHIVSISMSVPSLSKMMREGSKATNSGMSRWLDGTYHSKYKNRNFSQAVAFYKNFYSRQQINDLFAVELAKAGGNHRKYSVLVFSRDLQRWGWWWPTPVHLGHTHPAGTNPIGLGRLAQCIVGLSALSQ